MKYIVEGPDGKRYVVEGPDAPAAPAAAPAPAEPSYSPVSESGLENFRAGAGQALTKAGRGVKQLIDPLATGLETVFGGEGASRALGMPTALESAQQTDAAVKEAERLDAPLMKTKAGLGGNIAGNIALVAVPGASLQKSLQAVTGAGRLGTALAAGGSGAGTEFVTAEGDLGDKAKSAAVSGALGMGLTGALGALAKPFRASVDAAKLYAQGLSPTLQQAADSSIGRFIGGLAAGGQGVKERQRGELANAILARVGASTADDTGRGVAQAARQAVGSEYDALLGGKQFDLTPQALGNAVRAAGRTGPQGQMAQEARAAQRIVGNIVGPANQNTALRQVTDKELYEGYLTKLNEAARETTSEEVKRRILDARKALLEVRDAQLSPAELAKLRAVDVKNFDVNRLREATEGAAGEQMGVSLNQLAQAYGKNSMPANKTMEEVIGPAIRTIGKADRANEARSAAQTAMRIAAPITVGGAGTLLGAPAVVPALAGAYGLSALGQTAKGARMLTGQQAWQTALADRLRAGYVAGIPSALTELEGSNYAP